MILRFGKKLRAHSASGEIPFHQECDPAWIRRALERSVQRDAGSWYVVDGVQNIASPRRYRILGRELVVWRHQGQCFAAPDRCPHMGASLQGARCEDGKLICPWHGLALGSEGQGVWKHLPVFNDGVLFWVWLGEGRDPQPPLVPPRPTLSRSLEATVRLEACCEPRDVVANRLDPWHGVPFHNHSFASMQTLERDDDSVTVRVAYRVFGPVCVEVSARFDAPDSRTVVMRIMEGEGAGSVVETHATPMNVHPSEKPRTSIVETTLATSERAGFTYARRMQRLLRPLMEQRALRLWEEDRDYAERLANLRGL